MQRSGNRKGNSTFTVEPCIARKGLVMSYAHPKDCSIHGLSLGKLAFPSAEIAYQNVVVTDNSSCCSTYHMDTPTLSNIRLPLLLGYHRSTVCKGESSMCVGSII